FSASAEKVAYGKREYRQRSPQTSTLLDQLLTGYQQEGIVMPYTMDDFRHDYLKEHVQELPPEERLKGMSPEELLAGLSPEQIELLREKLIAEQKPSQSRKRRRK